MRKTQRGRWAAKVLTLVVVVATLVSSPALTFAQAGETVSLYDAIRDGRARVTLRGTGSSSGPGAMADVVKGPKAPAGELRLHIPPGTMLRNANGGAQDMLVAGVLGRFLGEQGGSVRFNPGTTLVVSSAMPVTNVLAVYCAEFEKGNPNAGDRFTLEAPDTTLAAILRQSASLSVEATQAAVWMHTDQVTFAQMNETFAVNDGEWSKAQGAYERGLGTASRRITSRAQRPPAAREVTPAQQPGAAAPAQTQQPSNQGRLRLTVLTNKSEAILSDAGIHLAYVISDGLTTFGGHVPVNTFSASTGIYVTGAVVAPDGVRLNRSFLPWASLRRIDFSNWANATTVDVRPQDRSQTKATVTMLDGSSRDVFVLLDKKNEQLGRFRPLFSSGPLQLAEVKIVGKIMLGGEWHDVEIGPFDDSHRLRSLIILPSAR